MAAEPVGDDLAGRTLGDFVLGNPIGAGGFGAVYEARQPALERDAVIKILSSERRGEARSNERFLREAKLASRLDHPFAAHIYAFGAEPDGLLWIAMERVHGVTLRALLKERGALSTNQFGPLFDRLAEVVSAAHDQGIIHRDLKPENVMVISRGGKLSPKLLDLGIARIADDDTADGPRAPLADGPIDRLTRDGGITGSPHYMAPEQWVSPRDAGASADQYALAAIAYECLTGELAFPGTRVFEVARAHAKGKPPTLGDEFPEALGRAIERGLAKKPADRHDSVAELAQAVRDATDSVRQSLLLPELDPAISSEFSESGPQPIAAAVRAYEDATTLDRSRRSLLEIIRATIHLLALYGLAARARRSSGPASEALARELASLRKDGLTDAGWLRLASLLTEPFAGRVDVHPMPELVMLLHGEGAAPLADLLELPIFGELESESELLAAVREAATATSALLARVRFLFDYPIAQAADGLGFVWRGPGRRRLGIDAQLPDGGPVCIDSTGTVVLDLAPLVQIAEPNRGARKELFMLSGPGRRGARLISHPVGFAVEDDDLWSWFAEHLDLDLEAEVATSISERAPYRGLEPFSTSDADWFYGREQEAQALANRLGQSPFVAIVGPSGAGKSSFVRAGVLPILPGDWTIVSLRPGHRPLPNLSAALAAAEVDRTGDETPAEALEAHANAHGVGVLVVVDQFEELFTLCGEEEQRADFAQALAAAGAKSDRVRVIITLRDDFLMRAESLPHLGPKLASSLELLGMPSEDGLRRILIEPAKRAGFSFESEELVDDMVAAVASKPGALPLLSFTAAKLWDLRDRHFKTLSRVAYESLGGVGGALAQHATSILESRTDAEAALVREAFRHLVTAEGTRAILTRGELEQLLGGGDDAESVIEELVGGRLLVASESADGADQIEITHEALLDAWPQLVEWRREDAENARLRDQLRAAARQWSERDRPRGLLWRSDALAEYRIWRARYSGRLTDVEAEFGRASIADANRVRTVRRVLLAVAFIALSIGLIVIYRSEVRARKSAEESVNRLADFYREQGRRELDAKNPAHALVYLSEVVPLAADDSSLRYLYRRARDAFAPERLVLQASDKSLFGARVTPDRRRVVTFGEDGVPRFWELPSGRLIRELKGVHEQAIYGVDFAKDGTFATVGDDPFVTLWTADGEVLAKMTGHEAGAPGIYTVQFDHAGERLVTAGNDKTARIWDAKTGEQLVRLAGHGEALFMAAFSADGERVLTSSVDGTARVWDSSSGEQLAELAHHKGLVWTARWSPDEKLIVTTSADGSAALSDGATGALVRRLAGHSGWVTEARFSPDGGRLVTVSRDSTAIVFDVGTGEPITKLVGHSGQVNRARFVSDNRIVTASADGSVRLWSDTTGALEEIVVGHTSFIFEIELLNDLQLLTASWDGSARIWDLSRRRVVYAGPGRDDIVAGSSRNRAREATAQTEAWFAIANHKQKIRVAETRGIESHVLELPEPVTAIAISGNQLAAATTSGGLGFAPLPATDIAVEATGSESAIVALAAVNSGFVALRDDGTLSSFSPQGAPSGVVYAPLDPASLRDPENQVIAGLAPLPNGFAVHAAREVRRYKDEAPQTPDVFKHADHGVTAFDVAGDLIAYSSLSVVTILSPSDKRTLEHGSYQMSVALSADGSRLLTGNEGGDVTLWNTETGEQIAKQAIHGGWVTSVAFHPNGVYGLSTGADQRAKVFELRDLVVLDILEPAGGEILLSEFVGDGSRALVWSPTSALVWKTDSPAIDEAEAVKFARCDVGWELDAGRIRVRKQAPADCQPK